MRWDGWTFRGVLGLAALGACLLAPAALGQKADEPGEKKITIDQVPAPAKAAILKAVGDGRIVDIGEITDGGKVIRYEVECIKGGQEIDIVVAPDGRLLTSRQESSADAKPPAAEKPADADEVETSSKEVSLDQVAAAVRETILKEAGKNTIKEVEEKVINGKTVYEASWIVEDKEIEVQVAPDGKVIKRKVEQVGPAETQPADAGKAGEGKAWRSSFKVDKKNLASVGRNPYFMLIPGRKLHLADGKETVVITVLAETKTVDGVETRVVEERETKNGRLAEVSRNYFAIDKTTNDVYYFGEDVDDYDASGKVVGHGGGWLSGADGARFGLFLPGGPKVGDRFYQEVAPKVAMDRAEIVQLDATLKTPMRTFTHCLYVRESTPLESGLSHKWFAAGVGIIGDDDLRLVKVEEPPAEKD